MLVADAYRLVSDALARALQTFDFEVLEDLPASGKEAVATAAEFRPNIVLLDFWMPGMKAPAATRLILSAQPECKVILLSWLMGTDQIVEGLAAGAAGFLPKTLSVPELSDAIRRAHAGESPVYEQQLDRLMVEIDKRRLQDEHVWQRLAALTPREIEVLELMNKGRLIEEVAKDLSIKSATVRKHVHNIIEKMDAQSYIQALAIARDHGLISS